MSFNPGDKVKWVHPEPYADPDELRGEIIEILFTYRVKFNDGTIEICDEDDLEADVD